MTEISTKPILGSIAANTGRKIATLAMRYPRAVHAELMTHRAFSRNASSSRAIPIAKLIAEAETDYAEPIHWGKNQPGMQAREELTGVELGMAKESWHRARLAAIKEAHQMAALGAAKQLVNRILEPYTHITVLVTSTSWANFLALRDHKDAEPHIAVLAREVRKALETMEFEELQRGQWHLPYVPHWERADVVNKLTGLDWRQKWDDAAYAAMCKVSAARCARVSFLNHDGTEPVIEKDSELFDRLAGGDPIHASPLEHQATPDEAVTDGYSDWSWRRPTMHGNFEGFIQFRKTLPNEAAWGFM